MSKFPSLLVPSLLLLVNAGLGRVPKIYNALISSDENLTPSQAFPVLEPVLRTTALGVAFPPLLVHDNPETAAKPAAPKINYHGTLYPLAYEPYFPYAYTPDYLYPPPLPYYHQQQPVLLNVANVKEEKKGVVVDDTTRAPPTPRNFKKNPEIPDVPPPPLPIKNGKRQKT